eukprot:CAMPEP_0172725172 /NCGR_PEP_ID=MMETSP1074-20121228/87743_1 /TAXON_ID=2916 /ORGANISM="Ceratium fusus, Strain PA161109" /LENGTH=406 /DNA_ID=CAMNT_0013551877 /DNA_START=65 /DNA_END=1285 /DNA_ORIENTATION=-
MEVNPETVTLTRTAVVANKDFSTVECANRYMCSIYMYYSLLLKWPRHFAGPQSFNAGWLPDWCLRMPLPFRFLYMLCIPVPLNAVQSFLSPMIGYDPKGVEEAQGKWGQAAGGIINKGLQYMYKDLVEALTWAIGGFGRQINPSWFHKNVWRGILPFAGCTVPPCVAQWNHKRQAVDWLLPLPEADLIVKPVWGGLGAGDFSLRRGVDWTSQLEAEDKIKAGIKEAIAAEPYLPIMDFLILERILPDPSLGVHSFEILTMRTGDDRVVTARIGIHCGGSLWTSHGSPYFLMVDPETETICCPEQWLKIRQGWPANPDMMGRKIPGMRAMCRQAEAAHQLIIAASRMDPKLAWLKKEPFRVIGWDAMVTEHGNLVWFEGNMPLLRLSRFLCSSWAMMFQYRELLDFK